MSERRGYQFPPGYWSKESISKRHARYEEERALRNPFRHLHLARPGQTIADLDAKPQGVESLSDKQLEENFGLQRVKDSDLDIFNEEDPSENGSFYGKWLSSTNRAGIARGRGDRGGRSQEAGL